MPIASRPRFSVLPVRPAAQNRISVLSCLPDLRCSTTPSSSSSTVGVILAVADQHAAVAQVVAQSVDDLVVEELQQLVARVDQVHLDAQVAEHRSVFAADDAGAVNRDGARRIAEPQDRVAVEHARPAEVDIRRAIRPRTGGDDRRSRPSARACRRIGRRLPACARRESGRARERSARCCVRRSRAASRPVSRSPRRPCAAVRETRR